MKSIILYISLLLLISSGHLYAQSCLPSQRFDFACGSVVVASGCSTWTDNCGDGWVRSHGTPQMVPYTYTVGGKTFNGFYVQMWATSSSGEGMFKSYNFQANHTYDVMISIGTTNASGSILVYAANGLSQSALSFCGGQVPNIPSRQLIGQFHGSATGWLDVPFTFTANANYSQLWIYPVGSGGTQYDMAVRLVNVCPSCNGTIVYNNGVVPTGETRSGGVWAGSSSGSGGSGIITVNPTATTTLLGNQEATLQPEFEAVVTTGAFTLKAIACGQTPTERTSMEPLLMKITPSADNISDTASKNATRIIDVYPSAGNGVLRITADSKVVENIDVMVFDLLGRQLVNMPKHSLYNNSTLDLSNLKNGIYILQLRRPTQVITKKIVIQH